jgi:hypothetical protein
MLMTSFLITETTEQMRAVIKTCEQFGEDMDIKFNPEKTQIMAINHKNDADTAVRTRHLYI